jgi:uncharacterized protein YeaO (DUF488 family)
MPNKEKVPAFRVGKFNLTERSWYSGITPSSRLRKFFSKARVE